MKKRLVSAFVAAMALGAIVTLSDSGSAANLMVPGTYGYPDAYQYGCFTSYGSSLTLSTSCPGGVDRLWMYPVLRHDTTAIPHTSNVTWTVAALDALTNGGYICGRTYSYNADGTNLGPSTEQCAVPPFGTSVDKITNALQSGGGQVVLVMRMSLPSLGRLGVTRVFTDGF